MMLLPVPALWVMLRLRWFLIALAAIWSAAIGLVIIESDVLSFLHISMPSGGLSVLLLISPYAVLPFYLILRVVVDR